MYCTEAVMLLSVLQYLLLGTNLTDAPLAHCTHEPIGPVDNSVLFETTVRS